jgi:hypothetical protein
MAGILHSLGSSAGHPIVQECEIKVDLTSKNWARAAGQALFQEDWAFLPFQTGRPAARVRLASIKRCKRRNIL